MSDLRIMILQACANSEENGYILDEDDEQEAIDIIGKDADIADVVPDYWGDNPRGDVIVEQLAGYVREYKNGARA